MEIFHAIAPPVLGIIITIFSFLQELFITRNIREHLIKEAAANSESIIYLVKGALALSTFIVNAFVLLLNFALAWTIYPIESMSCKIALVSIDVLAITVVVLQIIWLFSQYDAFDISTMSLWKRYPKIKIDGWLRREQISFNIITVVFFIVGFFISKLMTSWR